MSTSQKMFQAAGIIMVANLLSRVLGLLRESLMSYHFSLSPESDAYQTAFILPDFLFWILAGGMISAALIPVLSDYMDDSQREERWRIVNSIINLTTGIMIIVCLAAVILAPYFIKIMIPLDIALDNQQSLETLYKQDLATSLTRLLLAQPIFMALSGIAMGVLNAKKIFWPSSLGSLLYNVAIITVAGLLAVYLDIYAFVYGVLLGALLNFVVQIPHLKKIGFRYKFVADWRHPAVRRIVAMSIPIFILQALNQFMVATYSNLSNSLGTGNMTAVTYAYRISFMVVGVFAVAVSIASFPTMAEHAAHRERRNFVDTFSQSMRMVIFISIPASVGIILLRTPLISTLFEHGSFGASDTAAVSVPLIFFAIGITFQGLIMVIPRAFYAFEDSWRPVLIGVLSMLCSVGLMTLFSRIFPDPYKTGGIALAMSLGALLQTLLLFIFLRRKIGPLDGRNILTSAALTTVASAVMAVVLYMWEYMMKLWLPPAVELTGLMKKAVSALELFGGICVGFLMFILLAKAFCMEEFTLLVDTVRRKKTNPNSK